MHQQTMIPTQDERETYLTWRWCSECMKGCVKPWLGLHVGGHDLSVFAQVDNECIAAPASLDFDNVNRDSME